MSNQILLLRRLFRVSLAALSLVLIALSSADALHPSLILSMPSLVSKLRYWRRPQPLVRLPSTYRLRQAMRLCPQVIRCQGIIVLQLPSEHRIVPDLFCLLTLGPSYLMVHHLS